MTERSDAPEDEAYLDYYAGLHPAKLEGTADPMMTLEWFSITQIKDAFMAGRASVAATPNRTKEITEIDVMLDRHRQELVGALRPLLQR